MKKLIIAALALLALPTMAVAQQYVSPIYTQDSGMQPYAQPVAPSQAPPTQAYAAPPVPQPAVGQNVIPLSSGPVLLPMVAAPPPAPAPANFGTATYSNTGYGTAVYSGDAAPAGYVSVPAYVATPAYTTAAPAPKADDMFATQRPARIGYNWTGCYGGGYVGTGFGATSKSTEPSSQGGSVPRGTPYNFPGASYSYDMDTGFMGGGTLGCNYEIFTGTNGLTGLVLGVEGEGGEFNMTGHGTDPNSGNVAHDTNDKAKISDWDAIIAGRVGTAFDRVFLYGKFGAVFSNASGTISDNCTTGGCGHATLNASGHTSVADPALGGGIEYAFDDAWSVKGEYMYLDTSDDYEVCGPGGGNVAGSTYCARHELGGTHTVKVGLNYHFNDFLNRDRGGAAPRW